MATSLGAPLTVLTRPVASDQDPAAGFSFTKAKPIQNLDFGRPKQTPITTQSQDPPPQSGDIIPIEGHTHQSPPLPNTVNAAAHQGPSPKNHTTSVAKDPLQVPFPNATFATTVLASGHSLAKTVKIIDQPQANMQNRSLKASRDPLTSVAQAPKITKSRGKKTRIGAATDCPPQPLSPKYAYTEDDLLRLLMYRRRQGQQELEHFRTTQQQKETEIQRLQDISNNLYSQLQDVEHRETQTNAELTKIKANKPIWESKIKRLSDYVKGLTNDHNRLRDDADDLRKRHEMETLAQTIQHQDTQLRSEENLFMAERERSNRLEYQISGITASHEQLLHLFTGHRDTITGKIDDLLHRAQSIVPPTKGSESDPHNPITPMLGLKDSMNSIVEGYVSFLYSIITVPTQRQDCSFGRSLQGNFQFDGGRTKAACASCGGSTSGLERQYLICKRFVRTNQRSS